MKKQHFFFLLLLASVLSCTIQKRTVNKGYFVQWHSRLKPAKLPVTVHEARAGMAAPPENAAEIALPDSTISAGLPGPENYRESAAEKSPESGNSSSLLPQTIRKTVQSVQKQQHEAKTRPQPKMDPGTARGLFIFRAVWNGFLFGFALYTAFLFGLLLLFAGEFIPLFVFSLFISLHVLVASIYKAVMFMKMARILARVKQSDSNALAEQESMKKKIIKDRLRINLFFLILYIVFLLLIFI
ncbi:MAG: hypothetical protein ACO1O6_12060 [Bacteroidota bacterium]